MITKWLLSYKLYSLSVVFAHIVILAIFFPIFAKVLFYTITVTATFCLFWLWCELMNEIETANREQLVHLIEVATNPRTKDALRYQLYIHDRESIVGSLESPYQY
tara:strand:+ start:852 stop:1166 length:315 start_codon:yes stop_codon:yes gene_type:complete